MWNQKPIIIEQQQFVLNTAHTAYLFRVSPQGHLEHVYYGRRVQPADMTALASKRTSAYGDSISYDAKDSSYCLDAIPLEWSGCGRGDFRESPLTIQAASGPTTDFKYQAAQILNHDTRIAGLPNAYGAQQTLRIRLSDATAGLDLDLYYAVYPQCDVITRRCVLHNAGKSAAAVSRLMSLCLDMQEDDLVLCTFSGGWADEAHRVDRPVAIGTLVSQSGTGFSSSRTNPGFLLRRSSCTENAGEAWGFNLVYSGSHYASISRDEHGSVRVMNGISPQNLNWLLKPGDSLASPEAVMTYSSRGLNQLTSQFHRFVNHHIVRGDWQMRPRPVLVNSWEACLFRFDQRRLLSLAQKGKKLGAELFVLDDGWFGKRDNDHAGLGDYTPNPKKLPEGIRGLSSRIHALGMKFGLWFEPEAVNPDSDLYRAHPDWAVPQPGRQPVQCRNELLLDLSRKEVRDYIVAQVSQVLDEGQVDYVKWDMNGQLANSDGAFDYRYLCGLYEVLDRIFTPRPQILLESCSSGGNRFDLGMLCYSPQIWASDDTDPIERLDIQKGLSYLYPQSTIGAHVSASPHAQTLRSTPLATRFAVAAFGVLGYEMDLNYLTPQEEKEVTAQIAFYKAHRQLFQFGTFRRSDNSDPQLETFSVIASDRQTAVAGTFRRLCHAAPAGQKLQVSGLTRTTVYTVVSQPHSLRLSAIGGLVQYAMPVRVNPYGLLMHGADRIIAIPAGRESYQASGSALQAGIPLANLFCGTGYSDQIRIPNDFGAELYLIQAVTEEKGESTNASESTGTKK